MMLAEVFWSLRFKVASGTSWVRQQAAIHMSLTGRGRPRRVAAADSLPQVAATASSPGSTAILASRAASSPRRRSPQLRISVPLRQLAEGDERNQHLAADQPGGEAARSASPSAAARRHPCPGLQDPGPLGQVRSR